MTRFCLKAVRCDGIPDDWDWPASIQVAGAWQAIGPGYGIRGYDQRSVTGTGTACSLWLGCVSRPGADWLPMFKIMDCKDAAELALWVDYIVAEPDLARWVVGNGTGVERRMVVVRRRVRRLMRDIEKGRSRVHGRS